jgi:DNA-directed RNA polymerase subunit beta'
VRRERLGQIALATPVSHVWFFKGLPSRIGHLLDLSLRDLERILYFEAYVVIDAGETDLKDKQLLTEEQYRQERERLGFKFKAQMGAEAIKELLRRVHVERLAEEMREKMRNETSAQKKLKYAKRLKVVDAFRRRTTSRVDDSDVIPVIPPEAAPARAARRRPVRDVDLNDLYRPRHQPQQPVEEAHRAEGAGRHHPQRKAHAPGSRGRALRQRPPRPRAARREQPAAEVAVGHAQGQAGPFRQNLLGKRVDYSGRSVIVVGPELKLHQCGLAEEDGARAVQAVHLQQARNARARLDHQASQGDGRAAAPGSVGHPRGSHPRASRSC